MRQRRRRVRLAFILVAGILLSVPVVDVARARAAAQQPAGAVPGSLAPGEYFVGTPWTGAAGVTETVADLMAREARQPATVAPGVPRERRPEQGGAEARAPKGQNPAAPG